MDGKPIPGAGVNLSFFREIMDENGQFIGYWPGDVVHPRSPASTSTALATTDAQGRYEITNIPRFWAHVEFRLRFSAPGFVWKDKSFRPREPLLSEEMSAQLYRAGFTVTGRATNDRGKPLVGYEVYAKVDGDTCSTWVKTDANGRFAIANCPMTPDLTVHLASDRTPYVRIGNTMGPSPSFVYYPAVEAGIAYEPGKTKYEVGLVAVTPDMSLTVVLKDSAGLPVPHFPVELRGPIRAEEWMNRYARKRTDTNGVCVFKDVPQADGMQLFLEPPSAHPVVPFAVAVPEEEKKRIDAEHKKYRPVMVPVNLEPDKKEQKMEVTILTWEERKAQDAAKK
jgi:hypothetical protein